MRVVLKGCCPYRTYSLVLVVCYGGGGGGDCYLRLKKMI